MGNKTCTKCKVTKPVACFHRAGKQGRSSRCSDCTKEYMALRRAYLKERHRKRNVYDGADKACSTCKKVFPRVKENWLRQHEGDGLNARCRKCHNRRTNGYAKTGDIIADIIARINYKWDMEIKRQRYGKQAVKYEDGAWTSLLEKQKFRCFFTNDLLTPENVSVDHIRPLSAGGTHDLSNLRLTTKQVNRMKSDYSDDYFIELCKKVAANSNIPQNVAIDALSHDRR